MSLPLPPPPPQPVPISIPVQGISSPTLTTPKPHVVALLPIHLVSSTSTPADNNIATATATMSRDSLRVNTDANIRTLSSNGSRVQEQSNGHAGDSARTNANDHSDGDEEEGEEESHHTDGRMTPLAESNPSSASSAPSPNPSTDLPPSTPTFTANISHPAEIGLGVQIGEEQLRTALQSKDRMFVLVLAKELEAFIRNVVSGQATTLASQNLIQGPTTSILASLGMSTPIGVIPTSKFQRMLVYKAAEWYGLKAVPGPDGSMIVGVLGTFNEKSMGLRLSELVPAAPSPIQKFRIMQRAQSSANGGVDGASTSSDNGANDGRQSKWKTMEEREAAYALAREKIYGRSDEADGINNSANGVENASVNDDSTRADGDRDRTVRGVLHGGDDEIDPVPRRRPPNNQYDNIIYPSLYHPPKAEPPPPPPAHPTTMQEQYPPSYQYQAPAYAQTDINGYPIMAQMADAYGPASQMTQPQQPYGMMQQPYMPPNQGYLAQPLPDVYARQQQWQPAPQMHTPYPTQAIPPNQQQYIMPNQQNVMGNQNWGYPQMPMPPANMNPPMPMIPQGVTYPSTYGYHQQQQQSIPPPPPHQQQQHPSQPLRQGSYPPLVQPTPTRPHPHPHSSASSSISSRSYQSYQDGSRPHSRGSTTSTRSAASSVRLGALYPANSGPGFRQQGMMGQGLNGLTSMSNGLNGERKRSHRGHSPSSASTTTTSSRSSRRTSSIQLSQPVQGQHQLPLRPDWAAKNVPYHPSPLPINLDHPIANGHGHGPSTTEFPPLMPPRHGTNAEPMQVERAKIKVNGNVNGGTVWNGHLHHPSTSSSSTNHVHSPVLASPKISIVPGPRSRTPLPPHIQAQAPTSASTSGSNMTHLSNSNPTTQGQGRGQEVDVDFPRRIPTRIAPTLYDPSASTSASASVHQPTTPISAASAGTNSNTNSGSRPPSIAQALALSPEEVIEAKLAAVSINAGVSIGPPPSRGSAPSYAKIVRRD